MSKDSIISLQNVNKWVGDFHGLQDVNLEVKKKERIVVCWKLRRGQIYAYFKNYWKRIKNE